MQIGTPYSGSLLALNIGVRENWNGRMYFNPALVLWLGPLFLMVRARGLWGKRIIYYWH
jgi:hypothetical protein